MKKYRLINNIVGWVVFIIASVVYISTIESTASFWDCGEFIATAFKLEVGHPPGAPFFMIFARLFSLFAGGNVAKVPVMVNILSALASGFTILFLFWTITHLAKKIIAKSSDTLSTGQLIAIMGSGIVGALAYTFTDSFWFSAVEGEVYASSSFFTAIVFWAILKWEDVADQKHANRWIIFIAYMMGLSIGVHLLNLLTIPALVMVYYFKKYPVTKAGIFKMLLIAVLLLGGVMYVIIPGVFVVASWFELFFVNTLHFGYNSGVIVYSILLIGLVVWGNYYTYKKKKVLANTVVLAITVILIGYSSFAMTIIRSAADPPLDEDDPHDVFSLLSYLNREQYGDRPLLYGPTYNAPIVDSKEGKPTYTQLNGKYVVTNREVKYVYDDRFNTLFPRMYSREQNHVASYQDWADVKGTPIQVEGNQNNPQAQVVYKPTFGENMKFFFRYQIGYMYLRYFMWNFAGRQNDMEGTDKGDILHGNWICGINFIDEARLGPQDNLPDDLKNNKARNTYYLLPLILGLIGAFYHWRKYQRDFWVVMMFFIMTGLAIVIYLNQTPYQPRDRDYAYAGSFYAFAIWIGIGVLAIADFIKKKVKVPEIPIAVVTTGVCLLAVPCIMAEQNWDDHNRSGRYTCRDFAYNYLNSCAPNAILFTNGDNDTFPLWYIQEVEGVRTDVRVCNLSYLSADWYIKQMGYKANQSDPLPISMPFEKYLQGTRDVVYLMDRIKDTIDLKEAMQFVASDDPQTKQVPNYSGSVDYIPGKNLSLKVDRNIVLANGTVSKDKAKLIVPAVNFSIQQPYITKSGMMILEMLAHNNWKRPIYFAITVSNDNYLNLDPYFQVEGLAYRIVPIKAASSSQGELGTIDTKIMYNNMINKFRWGGVDNPKVYLDENNLRMLSNFRSNFGRLANALIDQGKKDSARVVLNRCMKIMPNERVPFNYFILPIAEGYYRLKDNGNANKLVEKLLSITESKLRYYFSVPQRLATKLDEEKRLNLYVLKEMGQLAQAYNQKALLARITSCFGQYMNQYERTAPQQGPTQQQQQQQQQQQAPANGDNGPN
ncbi:MAG: DUF2723 domain-containing protein [Bacteroidota bacterium]|nr:DUF2723 domain-containing protein [Bacteroidota bacterium]MDP4273198.1 DUF2723 domain-containing protein [Bacteroidota bacterium]